jgi:hypothetical protein
LREPVAALGYLTMTCLGLAGCGRSEAPARPAGSLEVQWVGSDTGRFTAPVVAEWCDSLRLLELRALRGDTGVALALYPTDSVAPGQYKVVPPQRGDSARPAAAVALRWFAETAIRGFRSDSGTVTLTAGAGRGVDAGRFSATLRSANEGSRLTLAGSFSGLTVAPGSPECAGAAPDPDDTDPDLAEEFRETAD